MPHWKNIYLENHIHFFTAVIHGRVPVFTDPRFCRMLLSIWDFHREKHGFAILGYVLMPDHIHLMTHFENGRACEEFHRASNRYFARHVVCACEQSQTYSDWLRTFADGARRSTAHRVWGEEPRVFALSARAVAEQKLNYMHMNPVGKGLVEDPCDWEWSSARNYALNDHSAFRVDVENFPQL